MILTSTEIMQQHEEGKIVIVPFDKRYINPNSYDIHLGTSIFKYRDRKLDMNSNNEVEIIDLVEGGVILEKDVFYYAYSNEEIGSSEFVPMLHNKSGIARMGLFTHIASDLLSIGESGKVLIQLYPSVNLRVYPKMGIAQITFWKTKGEKQKIII